MSNEPFETLAGLPATGPLPTWIPAEWKRSGSEGFVVRFNPDGRPSWVGNFRPGLTSFSTVLIHPNEHHVLVIAGGDAYAVDAAAATAEPLRVGSISNLWRLSDSRDLVLDRQGVAFLRLGVNGLVWHTRRISWDGLNRAGIVGDLTS